MVSKLLSERATNHENQLSHQETPRENAGRNITILCDGVTLPANIGGILRLADAFGVEEVIFANTTADPNSRKVRQISRSTHQWVKYRTEDSALEVLQLYQKNEYLCIALEITNRSLPLPDLRIHPDDKIVLVIGSEISGVSAEVLTQCHSYHIPVYGQNSSMNVTQALAIGLYQLCCI